MRRSKHSLSTTDLIRGFLVAQDSPYRVVMGERVRWRAFVDGLRDWSGRQLDEREVKAAMSKTTPVGTGSGGHTFAGNVANGHSEVKRYEMVGDYMRLVPGKPFTPRAKYDVGSRVSHVPDARLVAFINQCCHREGSVEYRLFKRKLAKHLKLGGEWNRKQLDRQLGLLEIQTDGRIILGLSLLEDDQCPSSNDTSSNNAPSASTTSGVSMRSLGPATSALPGR